MEDHDRIAEEGEETANKLEELSGNLERDAQEARDDWHKKTQTESVPGAMELPDEDEDDDQDDEDEVEPYGEATGTEEVTPETTDASGGQEAKSEESGGKDDDG